MMRPIVLVTVVTSLLLTAAVSDAHSSTYDLPSARDSSVAERSPTTPPAAPRVERPRRVFEIWVESGGDWVEAGSLPANRFLAMRRFDLAAWIGDGATRVRIVPRNGGLAHVDAATLAGRLPVDLSETSRSLLEGADLDIMEVPPDGLELTFPAFSGQPALLELTARIEPAVISKAAFQFPPENTHHAMGVESSFYSYRPTSRPGRLTVDGDLGAEALGEPFFAEDIPCDSGHPQGTTYGWVMDDGETLYVALDFTPDNTVDDGLDYAAVYVERGGELVEHRVTDGEQRWGRTAFGPTDRAPYRHKTYELALPLADLVEPGSDRVRLAFAAYGTASAGANLADLPAYEPASRTYGLLFWELTTGYDLQAQRFDVDGVAVGGPMVLATTTDSQPFCGVAADPGLSAFLAVWIDWPTSRIMGRRFFPDGAMDPSAVEISDIAIDDEAGPARVEFDTVNRRYLVIWTDERTGTPGLYGRFVGRNGVPQGTGSFPIEDSAYVDRYVPALAHNPADNQFLVVWGESGNGVYGRRINATTGQFLGTSFQIEPSSGATSDLDAAYSAVDGSYLVTWTEGENAYARRVQPDATVGDQRWLITADTYAEWSRVSAHPRVPRYLVAVVDYGLEQVAGRLADAATGAGVGIQHLVTPSGENPEGIGSAANPHTHSLAVGYYDLSTSGPKIAFAKTLCVSGDPATTTELGVTATIGVRLCAEPSDTVVIDVVSTDPGEGTVAPVQLSFTTSDWFTEQPVTVAPVNDGIPDGPVTYDVTFMVDNVASADDYDDVIDLVEVTNLDAVDLIFYDGFESGSTSAWVTINP